MASFFIRRPIVAIVIAILTVIVGAITIAVLPIAQFPNIAPPEIWLQANYPGADAKTLEQAVATPIEQQVTGVDNMVAANAQIGVAKALFFPSLSLTGLGGLESNALHRFISEPSETWYGALSVSQPVFQGGALRSGLRLARAQWQEAVLSYRQTVQNALGQVSDSLIASQKNREFREQQELLTQAAQRSDQLSQVLYQHATGKIFGELPY